MREVPAALADRIEGGAASLCHAWIVTLADGARLGFTDHDGSLEVDGTVCRPGAGWTCGAADAAVGLEPGAMAAGAVLDAPDLTAEAIAEGRWDGAEVALWRVDWTAPALRVPLWRGRIQRLVRDGERLIAEIEGPMAWLKRVAGRTYTRTCDASLGDGRCGVDLAAAPASECDKRFATCRDVFGNTPNFRGFPDIPGDDFLAAHPGAGERHDGRSRR